MHTKNMVQLFALGYFTNTGYILWCPCLLCRITIHDGCCMLPQCMAAYIVGQYRKIRSCNNNRRRCAEEIQQHVAQRSEHERFLLIINSQSEPAGCRQDLLKWSDHSLHCSTQCVERWRCTYQHVRTTRTLLQVHTQTHSHTHTHTHTLFFSDFFLNRKSIDKNIGEIIWSMWKSVVCSIH